MRKILLLATLLLSSIGVWAQGITTSAINGLVTDSNGDPLPGASVIAVHKPTGTKYGVVTNVQGRYYFPNVRVGGPYSISVSFIGYTTLEEKQFSLALGENKSIQTKLSEETTTLQEVVVSSKQDDVINLGRTGASTNISNETIERNPSISRSLSDFTRLTPQAASGLGNGGTSIAGKNSRYNNITIDGAVNNDAFGLNSSGQPGSNAGTEIVSLDAIKEVSVVVSPYDVTQGSFSGGGINAVTRSGTNDIEASAYFFTRSEKTAGKTLGEDRQTQAPFLNQQYGVRIGAPIIKDKLFFFGSYEHQRGETPFTVNLVSQADLTAFGSSIPSTVSTISIETATAVRDTLIKRYQYDPGSFGAFTPKSENNKLFGRIDWNINDKHQLTIRHNYVKATQDELARSQNVLEFANNGFLTEYINNSTILEVNSRFSANSSNRFIAGWTTVDDNRNVSAQNAQGLFPHIDINIGSNRIIRAGGQRSSQGNLKSQDILQITNNFTLFKDKHTLTFGTHNEYYKIFNSFVNRYNGHYEYGSLTSFNNNAFDVTSASQDRLRVAYSLDYYNDRFKAVSLRFLQTGFYAQDEYQATENLRITAGIRLDIPVFIDKPTANPLLFSEYGLRTEDVPSGQLLWSPRIGFNWSMNEDRTKQLRGGVGIFTGRIPFVWVSNQYTNSGASLGTLDIRGRNGAGNTAPIYANGDRILEEYWADQLNVGIDDPAVRARIEQELQNIPTSEVNLMSRDFKLPQNLRFNLAYDFKLPFDVTATVEGIFTKTLNEINYENINLTNPTEKVTGDGRPRHTTALANNRFQNVLLINNTNKGYQYSLTGQLQRSWSNGFFATLAYNYGQSRDVNSGTNTTALSGWEFNPTPGFSNDQFESYSVWDLRHRVVGNISYRKEWLGFMATTVSIFYNGQSGSPFTYMVNGDLNGDGAFGNDIAYIPKQKNEILLVPQSATDFRTPAQIWDELNAFIDRDEYLREHRGQYAERNGARTPWESRFDVRFMHEFFSKFGGKRKHTIQITADIENFANMLDQEFGRDYFVNFSTYNLLRLEGFEGAGNTGRPVYSFDNTNKEAWQTSNVTSIWRMQLGVRYIF
jgi:Carboxypeptidase regulatory-like domain